MQFFRKKSEDTRRLFFYTDIHSLLCPSINDGVKDVSTAIELICGLSKLGINRMIITPDVTDELFPNNASTIRDAFNQLESSLQINNLNILLECSAEYQIDDLLFKQLASIIIVVLPNDHILIENSWIQELFNLDEFIFSLQSDHRLLPILAHPER